MYPSGRWPWAIGAWGTEAGFLWGRVQERSPSRSSGPGPLLVLICEPALVSCERVSVCWSVCM